MSDFLTLCQEVRNEAGISGSGPTTTIGQTDILGRVVNAVRDAYIRIQDDPKDWKWMWRDDGSENTVINTQEIVPVTAFTDIHPKSCKIYETAVGATDVTRLSFISYEEFDRRYGAIQTHTANRPIAMTQMPNGNIKVYPKPDKIYTITFDYQKAVQVLTNPTDTPEMPARFHPLIKDLAHIIYGGFDDAEELVRIGEVLRSALWRSLEWDQELRLNGQMVVIPE